MYRLSVHEAIHLRIIVNTLAKVDRMSLKKSVAFIAKATTRTAAEADSVIRIEIHNNFMVLIGANGYVLHRVALKASDTKSTILHVNARSLVSALKVFSNRVLTLSLRNSNLCISQENGISQEIRICDLVYPNYRIAIPTTSVSPFFTLDPAYMLRVLRKNKITGSVVYHILCENGGVRVVGTNPNYSYVSGESLQCGCEHTGKNALWGDYLLNSLQAYKNAGIRTINFFDIVYLRAVVIDTKEPPNEILHMQCIIMPCEVSTWKKDISK